MKKVYRSEEEAAIRLQALYASYGYTPYKMRKFEEYDLYVRNKSFLLSESVLTFTDPSGKLMALKPDVTLSVVRGCKRNERRKVCYNEKVYRPGGDGSFKEITQVGVEHIGTIDAYAKCEILLLACQSLSYLSSDYRLCLSNTDLFSCLCAKATGDEALRAEIASAFSQKNKSALLALSARPGVKKSVLTKLAKLSTLDGTPEEVFPALSGICRDKPFLDAATELKSVAEAVNDEHVRIDLSVTGDLNYYNGVIFRGYISGVGDSLLSGGQYDPLMRKMGKDSSAMGFAVYLDKIPLPAAGNRYDADLLLLYDDGADPKTVVSAVREAVGKGQKVFAAAAPPAGFAARKTVDLRKKEGTK